MMQKIIDEIRQKLQANIDEKTMQNSQKFFKEKIKFYGVKVPIVSKIGKEAFITLKSKPKKEIFAVCEKLWQSGYIEESFIACNLSYYIKEQYEKVDFKLFEHWVNDYITNWASCDTLCNHTIGTFIEMYPQYLPDLLLWAKSPNRWLRRAATVTLIIPARKGLFLQEVFALAKILFDDKDDLVQKGCGWLLKAASQAYQKEIFDFVMEHKKLMSRTALRYSIEKMPKDLKVLAMAK